MKRCIIFGALPVGSLPVKPEEGDLVIAADGGYEHALSRGITPDIVVGDFDSLGRIPDAENVIRLNVRKDDTDLEHAVMIAADKGCDDFIVYGAVGGKLDHTLGNIAVAQKIAFMGGRVMFYGGDSSFTVFRNGSVAFPARESGRISVFSLDGTAKGVSIRGLSFEAEDIELTPMTTRGVSNAFIGKQAQIAVKDGVLLIVFDTE